MWLHHIINDWKLQGPTSPGRRDSSTGELFFDDDMSISRGHSVEKVRFSASRAHSDGTYSALFVHNALYKRHGQYVFLDNDSLRKFTRSVYFDPYKCWCWMYNVDRIYLFWSTICFTFIKVHNIIFELFHESWSNKTI